MENVTISSTAATGTHPERLATAVHGLARAQLRDVAPVMDRIASTLLKGFARQAAQLAGRLQGASSWPPGSGPGPLPR
ncbi:MAG TPA: hypothetical protein VGH27_01595 [Streptosporangiaceae bacterium]|jgi:hypothetical protein